MARLRGHGHDDRAGLNLPNHERPPSMKHFPLLLTMLCATMLACSPSETIAPEPVETMHAALAPAVTRIVPLAWHPNPDWIVDANNGTAARAVPCGQSEPNIATWTQDIDAASLPHGARLEAAWLSIAPCDAMRSVLPDNLPVFAVSLVAPDGIVVSSLGAAQDQSQTPAEYAAPHRIFLSTFSSPPIDRSNYRVVVRMENEYGFDALSGMKITGLRVRYTPP